MGTQIATLFKRRVTLTLRDKRQLKTRFGTASVQGLIIGLAFFNIGDKLPVQQLSFLFMLLQIGALSNFSVMPEMIAQRLVFKFESSDGLYSTVASFIVDTAVNNTLAVCGNFLTTCIMYALSGLTWSNFGQLYFWSFICFFVMLNFFKIIAAVAPSHAESMQVAMPGLMLFILFNNFFVNQATAPVFMRWALYISPMAWTIEQIITGLYPANDDIRALYGYDDSAAQSVRAFIVLLVEAIAFQLIAIVCLAKLNKIQR
jgi:ABC-type multidrug transport system permease subunit